nr:MULTISPECIES: o-succinylbenzoate--CoA ligase [Bacillus]
MKDVLPNWLKKRAELSPNRIAIKMSGKELTFKELFDCSVEYASKLFEHGIQYGSRVGILQSNQLDMVITIHALMHLEAEIVLYNTRLTTKELEWQFKDSKLDWLITGDNYTQMIKDVLEDKAMLIPMAAIESMDKSDSFSIVEEFDLSKTVTIMYTSGTTGNPKGVIQTYGNHWWSAMGSMLNLGLHEKDIWLCVVPIFHISGLSILFRSVIYGITVILHEQFNEERVNRSIMEEEVTIISVVTATLNRMLVQLNNLTYPSSFRCMLLGGGPAPVSLLEECKEKNIPVFQTYGMTETSSQIVTLSPEYSLNKLGSAGKALFPAQIQIQIDDRKAAPNEVGEIMVKGPNITKGYLNREDATKSAIVNGWLKTGDMGYLDEDGFLFVVDRRSDLIISGGENIYPAEIESVLMKHPAVFEAGVTGIGDAKWGQVPVGFIVLSNKNVQVENLIEHCQSHLASYKVPKKMYIVDELPRNSSNKLLRRQLLQHLKEKL